MRPAASDQQLINVYYFCHPLYGKEVEIISHAKRANGDFYIISFFVNSKVYLPTWMADPLIYQQFCIKKSRIVLFLLCSLYENISIACDV